MSSFPLTFIFFKMVKTTNQCCIPCWLPVRWWKMHCDPRRQGAMSRHIGLCWCPRWFPTTLAVDSLHTSTLSEHGEPLGFLVPQNDVFLFFSWDPSFGHAKKISCFKCTKPNFRAMPRTELTNLEFSFSPRCSIGVITLFFLGVLDNSNLGWLTSGLTLRRIHFCATIISHFEVTLWHLLDWTTLNQLSQSGVPFLVCETLPCVQHVSWLPLDVSISPWNSEKWQGTHVETHSNDTFDGSVVYPDSPCRG